MRDLLLLLGIIVLIWIVVMTAGCTSNAPTRAKQCGYLQPDGTLVTYYCPMPTKYGNT